MRVVKNIFANHIEREKNMYLRTIIFLSLKGPARYLVVTSGARAMSAISLIARLLPWYGHGIGRPDQFPEQFIWGRNHFTIGWDL